MKARVSFSLCLPPPRARSRPGTTAPWPPLHLPRLPVLGRDEGRSRVLGRETERGEEEEEEEWGRKGRERGRIC